MTRYLRARKKESKEKVVAFVSDVDEDGILMKITICVNIQITC
jgi:hypothetical protein